MRKSKDPRMDPWGTPHARSAGSDNVDSTSTIKLRLARYDLNQEIVAVENFKIQFFQEVYYS